MLTVVLLIIAILTVGLGSLYVVREMSLTRESALRVLKEVENAKVMYKMEKESFQQAISSYFVAGEDGFSEFGRTADAITLMLSERLGPKIAESLKMALLGTESGLSRAEQGFKNEAELNMAEMENPFLGAALQSFPKLRKRVIKNPFLIGMASKFFEDKFGNPGGKSSWVAGGNNQGSFSDLLNKWR